MKLYFLCSARANTWGHAAFEQGELQKLLKCSRAARIRAFASLESAQLIAPDSTPLCIVLTGAIYRRGDRTPTPCREPSHKGKRDLIWIHYPEFGWEERPGQWASMINRDDGREYAKRVIAEHRTTTKTKTRTVTETETQTETVVSVLDPADWPSLAELAG
jgi:hypothetical protein